MATEANAGGTTLAPDEAFAVLGDGIRMEILQTLAEADRALPFSELRERVGVSDSGQFNYHLDKLVGHFVKDSEQGYSLQGAGQRVIEAVVSGAVTETPVIHSTRVDWPCPQCGAQIAIRYEQEELVLSCSECPGQAGQLRPQIPVEISDTSEYGFLGSMTLPPAAVEGRTAKEVLQVAYTWDALELFSRNQAICPRCSATMERTVSVCEDHDSSNGLCDACGWRDQVTVESDCTNCPHVVNNPIMHTFLSNTELLAFVTAHGHNPITPSPELVSLMLDYKLELGSAEPFSARVTFAIEGDELTLTVDDDLNINKVSK